MDNTWQISLLHMLLIFVLDETNGNHEKSFCVSSDNQMQNLGWRNTERCCCGREHRPSLLVPKGVTKMREKSSATTRDSMTYFSICWRTMGRQNPAATEAYAPSGGTNTCPRRWRSRSRHNSRHIRECGYHSAKGEGLDCLVRNIVNTWWHWCHDAAKRIGFQPVTHSKMRTLKNVNGLVTDQM